MISLKVIHFGPVESYLFLTESDIPIVIIAIICLFIAYVKQKKSKKNKDWNIELTGQEDKMTIESRDILMQPKKSSNSTENESKIPFTNFSLEDMYFALGVLFVVLFVVYVWLSEAKYS